MPLSSLPASGPTIPVGAQKVSLQDIERPSTPKEEVTDLSDGERVYEDPPLKDADPTVATATCSASGLMKTGTSLAITAANVKTGWICEDYETTHEVGKYATWSANWSYYPG